MDAAESFIFKEFDGSGYTERYVRVRIRKAGQEGNFYTVTPSEILEDATLLAG